MEVIDCHSYRKKLMTHVEKESFSQQIFIYLLNIPEPYLLTQSHPYYPGHSSAALYMPIL